MTVYLQHKHKNLWYEESYFYELLVFADFFVQI